MTNASESQEKVFAIFYLGDSVLLQDIVYLFLSTSQHSYLSQRAYFCHPSFSDFTYHFPERVPKTTAPI